MDAYTNSPLLTDLYEFTMAYTYFKQKKHEDIAYFDMFVRTIPDQGGYLIFNGLNQLIEQIKNYKFEERDLNYLRSLNLFDEEFLELPPEVIVTSMKANQRYFAVYKNEKLVNNFVVVSNALTDDFGYIISGNEKVLRPRLADAMFFYKNDIKNGLKNDGLKKLVFVEGLGTVYDKCEREAKIALYLAEILKIDKKKHERAK